MGPATTKDPIECSLVDYAYREIRKRIQIGTYPPGSRLSTQEISTALGVSRTPVVAALNRLVAEGIAEAIPRRGVYVLRLSSKKIRDLIEARIMIELYSVKPAIQNKVFYPEIIQHMEDLLVSFDNMGDYDYERASEAEYQFHYSIVCLSGNDELKKMYNANWGIGATYYMYSSAHIPLSLRIGAMQGHPLILKLLKKSDISGLEDTLRDHIVDALRCLNWIIDTNPENFG